MMPLENQYVKIIMKNLIQIEGVVKSWSDKKSVLLTNDGDAVIIMNTVDDVSVVKITNDNHNVEDKINYKNQIDMQFEKVASNPARPEDQILKIQKLSDLRIEQAKLDKEIIVSKFKTHELTSRKPVKYDQLGIFKK